MNRKDKLHELMSKSKFFKLVCGAGNEDAEEVKRLSIIYTLAGAKGMDVSANVNIVKSCMDGIDYAYELAKKMRVKLVTRPYITISVGMPGDHHVRKAYIDKGKCVFCKSCVDVCPSRAIQDDIVINKANCIGCGNCRSICPINDAISFRHNEKELNDILPKCIDVGAENIELHAAVEDDRHIMKEWETVNKINSNNHVSMCLDRLHLSDFALERRIKKAKEISGDRLIIQADGYPMSGGEDNYNTTLQAVAIADVINKRFNMEIDRKSKKLKYKDEVEVNILLSGGTNSLTADLAKKTNVRYQGVSIGTFARKAIKNFVEKENFYKDEEGIKRCIRIAENLVRMNVGDVGE